MRALFLTAVIGIAAASAVAVAQPSTQSRPRDAATLCLDPSGANHPPVCRHMEASRFASAPDICQCNGPYRQVEAPFCAKGEHPPEDSAAFETARAAAAAKNSSLFGATYKGQSMCVALGDQ